LQARRTEARRVEAQRQEPAAAAGPEGRPGVRPVQPATAVRQPVAVAADAGAARARHAAADDAAPGGGAARLARRSGTAGTAWPPARRHAALEAGEGLVSARRWDLLRGIALAALLACALPLPARAALEVIARLSE